MTVKDAAANSLLMFVAATCVVLIVKAIPAGNAPTTKPQAMQDGVQVMYLHNNTRCTTCRNIEAYAREAVETGFANELQSGRMAWQVVNYEAPGNEHYATDYNVLAATVVFAKFAGGRQVAWKNLMEVWDYKDDRAASVAFVQESLKKFLAGDEVKPPVAPPPPPVDASPSPLPIPQ